MKTFATIAITALVLVGCAKKEEAAPAPAAEAAAPAAAAPAAPEAKPADDKVEAPAPAAK